jgi:hypothetical protein
MDNLVPTKEPVKADISSFDSRIESTRQQILALPATATGWQARKKLNENRK